MASKLSESYDKVALIAALVIALGLGAMVYLKGAKVKEDFPKAEEVVTDVPVNPREADIEATEKSLAGDNSWKPHQKDGRELDFATGLNIFVKPSGETVDLGDTNSEPVHLDIPNSWWLEHNIDPGFADSPDRDEDGDNFSNREEFEAKTDPQNPAKHPPLIAKLALGKLENNPMLLQYRSHTSDGGVKPTDEFQFSIEALGNRSNRSGFIPAGQGQRSIFFEKAGIGFNRFELKEVLFTEEENPATGGTRAVYTAVIEDKDPNKAGTEYKVRKGSRERFIIRDYVAQFYLDAINQQGITFDVKENESFTLPYDANAVEKPFKFVGVKVDESPERIPLEVIVEYEENGQTKTHIIPVPRN